MNQELLFVAMDHAVVGINSGWLSVCWAQLCVQMMHVLASCTQIGGHNRAVSVFSVFNSIIARKKYVAILSIASINDNTGFQSLMSSNLVSLTKLLSP